jgi:WD40 repeat protein
MLTAGKDAAVHLWQLPAAAGATGADSKIKAGFAAVDGPTLVSSCLGHSDTVAALATNHAGDLAATGGWDGKLLLWQTGGR